MFTVHRYPFERICSNEGDPFIITFIPSGQPNYWLRVAEVPEKIEVTRVSSKEKEAELVEAAVKASIVKTEAEEQPDTNLIREIRTDTPQSVLAQTMEAHSLDLENIQAWFNAHCSTPEDATRVARLVGLSPDDLRVATHADLLVLANLARFTFNGLGIERMQQALGPRIHTQN